MKYKNIFNLFLMIISILLFIVSLFFQSIDLKIISCALFLISNLIYVLGDIKKNILFLIFNCSFTLFLFSRFILTYFFGYKSTEYGDYGTNFSDLNTINTMLIIIFVSISFFSLSYFTIRKFSSLKGEETDKKIISKNVKISSILLFIVSSFFKIIYIKDQSSFVLNTSYYDFFLSYKSNLPWIVIKIAELDLVSFVAYLSTKPRKNSLEFRIIMTVFIIISAYSMVVGRRIEFMLNLLLIILYFVLTYEKEESSKMTLRSKLYILFGTPFVLAIMNYISFKRDGISNKTNGIFTSISHFLFSQGVSTNILGYTYEYRDLLPKDKIYSFGPLTDFLQNNIIYRSIFGGESYTGQTEARAMNGHLFAHTISFYIMPKAYLLGRGYGSSYVAELYYDFGYLGLIVFNIFVGILLFILPQLFDKSNWLVNVFVLLFMRNIILIPRAEFISFFTSSITLINILGIILIYSLSKLFDMVDKMNY